MSEQRGEKSTELQLLSQTRFCIRGDSSNTTRRCKVVKDFESLQAKVKDLFEVDQDEKIILYHGKNVVGSEEELIFAFDDRLNELKRKRIIILAESPMTMMWKKMIINL